MLVLVWSLTALSTALLVVALLWSWRGRYLLLLKGQQFGTGGLAGLGSTVFQSVESVPVFAFCAGVVSTPVGIVCK